MIDPMRVCELDAGEPSHHVPRFQTMAETRSEETIANPAPDPTFKTNSTGSSATTPNATAPEDVSTPMRFQSPDQITAGVGSSVCVCDHRLPQHSPCHGDPFTNSDPRAMPIAKARKKKVTKVGSVSGRREKFHKL
jgi:hypothetical protein